MNNYERIIPTLYMLIKLNVFETSNKYPTTGVEPGNILLIGRENYNLATISPF